ncbi:MAG TPA: RcnB family protein [Rhizomicrobium sp.]|nr:RcnB family protein [Rhizomicrobium sp.]
MKKLLFPAAALAAILSAPLAHADDQNGPDNRPKAERPARGGDNDRTPSEHAPRPAENGPATSGPAMHGPVPRTETPDRPNPNDTMRDRAAAGDHVRTNANDNDNDRVRNNDNDRTTIKNNDNDRTVIRNKTVVRKTVDRSVVLKVRANITAPHRYHAAKIYVRPAGWYPHRWVYGERLPRAFFAPDYFILDFAAYGLIAPWEGYEWVRYGDDALLIDLETGEVIRVEYDVFY